MFKRYMLIFLITTWVAMLPIADYLSGSWLDVAKSFLSLLYIIFLWKLNPIRERYLLMIIESAAMVYEWVVFYEKHHILSSESQWMATHEHAIMTYCFFLEIIIIIGGMARSEFRRLSKLRARNPIDRSPDCRGLFYTQGYL